MTDNKNAVTPEAGAIAAPAKPTEFKTYLIKIQQKYTDMVEKQFIEKRYFGFVLVHHFLDGKDGVQDALF